MAIRTSHGIIIFEGEKVRLFFEENTRDLDGMRSGFGGAEENIFKVWQQ